MSSASMPGSGGRGGQRALASNAVRGAGLIGLAMIVGIVLLQVVDNHGGSAGLGAQGSKQKVATVTSAPPSTGGQTTTTAKTSGARPRGEVRVLVFNGSGTSGAAGNTTNQLRTLGYQVDTPANTQARQGTVVACRQGFEKEAQQLAGDIGPGTQTIAFPNPPPNGVKDQDNCIVVLGK